MKRALLTLLFLASPAFAGSWTIGAGVGTERINDKLDVTLVEVRGNYRFDNGVILGAGQQKGYPENNGTIETRSELIAGYSNKVGMFMPYILGAFGNKTKSSGDKNVAYTSVTAGSLVFINEKWFIDTQYRYRDSIDNAWRTERLQAGLGHNFSKEFGVMASYGKSSGNFKSDAYSLTTLFRF